VCSLPAPRIDFLRAPRPFGDNSVNRAYMRPLLYVPPSVALFVSFPRCVWRGPLLWRLLGMFAAARDIILLLRALGANFFWGAPPVFRPPGAQCVKPQIVAQLAPFKKKALGNSKPPLGRYPGVLLGNQTKRPNGAQFRRMAVPRLRTGPGQLPWPRIWLVPGPSKFK